MLFDLADAGDDSTTDLSLASSASDESSDDPPPPPPIVEEKRMHARSVTLASDALGVVAKLDLVEAQGVVATPVDYKRGRRGARRSGCAS